MKISLEYLYHFRCDACGRWWSQADIEPQIGERLFCPACGHANWVEAIQTFRQAARNSCLEQSPDPSPHPSQSDRSSPDPPS